MDIQCHACIGGTNVRADLAKLEMGQHIVVGTPGRVHDMINRKALGVRVCVCICVCTCVLVCVCVCVCVHVCVSVSVCMHVCVHFMHMYHAVDCSLTGSSGENKPNSNQSWHTCALSLHILVKVPATQQYPPPPPLLPPPPPLLPPSPTPDPRNIKMFVLDEADEMLSRGFKDQIYDVFRKLPSSIQVRFAPPSDIRARSCDHNARPCDYNARSCDYSTLTVVGHVTVVFGHVMTV